MSIALDRLAVAHAIDNVGATGSLNPLPGCRLLIGHLKGPRLPLRPSVVRGGRILLGLAVGRRVIFISRLNGRAASEHDRAAAGRRRAVRDDASHRGRRRPSA